MPELQPIGTTFDIDAPPSGDLQTYQIESIWMIITYKVKAHKKYLRFEGDTEGGIGAEVEIVKIKRYKAIPRYFPGNQMIWEKGEYING